MKPKAYFIGHLEDRLQPSLIVGGAADHTQFISALWLCNHEGKRALIRSRLYMDEDGDVCIHVGGGPPDGRGQVTMKLAFYPMMDEEKPS